MNFVTASMKWTMLVAGLLNCTILYQAIAPYDAIQAMFGVSLDPSPVVDLVVRSRGVLVTLVGLMLIYGAFNVAVRNMVLLVAIVAKLVFIGLLIDNRAELLQGAAVMALILDVVFVVLFTFYLVMARTTRATPAEPNRDLLAQARD